ncbi:response regulator receiver domain protein [Marvinbryantia formatexigens DSM 14469]|uniref:Heme response regulator HssR n=2 Tax=Marvinbryantia TaxID=248744 RepID=C6LFN3_9FIRM|nr:response regulator receiver domain protein [Marvinbryantia formatexigens DSM 14469]
MKSHVLFTLTCLFRDTIENKKRGEADMFNILVVEDNADMRELFCTVLADHGYNSIPAADGAEALDIMDRQYIDLIVADIMMPNMDGYQLTKALRDANYTLPVLMVTAKDQFIDLQQGFRTGADDYMIKPVNVNELVLRVEALLRRARISSEKKITIGSTVLDYDALTVTIHGKETLLPQKEFYLLYKLLSYPNKIFTRQQLMDEIWGMFSETDERTVNTHINRLRDKFSDCSDFEIVTVRGLGYKAVKNVE